MPETIIYGAKTTFLNDAQVESDDLWLSDPDLIRATGWELKPQGVCLEERCVPIPADRSSEFLRPGYFNFSAFARYLEEPSIHAKEHSVWSFSEAPSEIRKRLLSLEAPDFSLPDLNGELHSLSDYRGKKVLLMSWASW
jgi:hypothetical protein